MVPNDLRLAICGRSTPASRSTHFASFPSIEVTPSMTNLCTPATVAWTLQCGGLARRWQVPLPGHHSHSALASWSAAHPRTSRAPDSSPGCELAADLRTQRRLDPARAGLASRGVPDPAFPAGDVTRPGNAWLIAEGSSGTSSTERAGDGAAWNLTPSEPCATGAPVVGVSATRLSPRRSSMTPEGAGLCARGGEEDRPGSSAALSGPSFEPERDRRRPSWSRSVAKTSPRVHALVVANLRQEYHLLLQDTAREYQGCSYAVRR